MALPQRTKMTMQLNENERIEVDFYVTDISIDDLDVTTLGLVRPVLYDKKITLTGKGTIVSTPITVRQAVVGLMQDIKVVAMAIAREMKKPLFASKRAIKN